VRPTGVHAARMPLAADVDLAALAGLPTAGMTGADLEALCGRAALGALERDAPTVTAADFAAALASRPLSLDAATLTRALDRH
jgi:ATP-dependent 26S proteasome regulatory subunit